MRLQHFLADREMNRHHTKDCTLANCAFSIIVGLCKWYIFSIIYKSMFFPKNSFKCSTLIRPGITLARWGSIASRPQCSTTLCNIFIAPIFNGYDSVAIMVETKCIICSGFKTIAIVAAHFSAFQCTYYKNSVVNIMYLSISVNYSNRYSLVIYHRYR